MVLPGTPTLPASDEDGTLVPMRQRRASDAGTLPGAVANRARRRSLTTSCLADYTAPLDLHPQVLQAMAASMDNTDHVFCETFHVLEIWEGEILLVRALKEGKTQDRLRASSSVALGGHNPAKARMLKPNGGVRATWDAVSLLLVIMDVILTPLTFFNLSETPLIMVLTWVARLFWTADILASFVTGYIGPDGGLVLSPRKVADRYVRSWLAFDLALVALDWLSGFSGLGDGQSAAQLSKAARIMRMLRMTRLLRLVRVQKVMGLLSQRIRSEKMGLIADIAKIVIMVLGFAHVLACIWYGLGRDDDSGWVNQSNFSYGDDIGRWYALSFHWSLAQFSGLGMDEIRVGNMQERIFAIVVTFLAFALASAVVSSLTSTLTRLHILASAVEKQVSTLRRYLSENGITADLSLRIQRNAQHRMKEQQHLLDESNVKLLELVSEALRAEMHFELFSPTLSEHPFLRRYCERHCEVMTKVCHCAVSRKSISRGDVVFNKGEFPSDPQMLFVESGVLEYEREDCQPEEVGKRRWIAEASLWTQWMHRGKLQAKTDCRLLVLDAKTFQDKVSQFYTSEVNPKEYARQFVNGLNEMEQGMLSDLTIVHTDLLEDNDSVRPRDLFRKESSLRRSPSSILRPIKSESQSSADDRGDRASRRGSNNSALSSFMRSKTSGL